MRQLFSVKSLSWKHSQLTTATWWERLMHQMVCDKREEKEKKTNPKNPQTLQWLHRYFKRKGREQDPESAILNSGLPMKGDRGSWANPTTILNCNYVT